MEAEPWRGYVRRLRGSDDTSFTFRVPVNYAQQ